MDKLLSKFAKETNESYHKLWRKFDKGELKEAYKDDKGKIRIKENEATKIVKANLEFAGKLAMPREVTASDGQKINLASTRRNAISTEPRALDRYKNVDLGFLPYSSQGIDNNTGITCRDVVILCQRAFFNFSSVHNVINVLTDFSSSNIYFTGGNEKSKLFFENYLNCINIKSLCLRFFREYYRSGNVFIYPLMGRIQPNEIIKLKKTFELNLSAAAKKVELPVKYIILNPADIIVDGTTSFIQPTYYKRLNSYEIARLKNATSESDKKILESLPEEVKKVIKGDKKTGRSQEIDIPLNTDEIYAIFYSKQDYEPFGVSMIFPVLDDLEWKQELKNIDKAISRTVSQVVLLVKTGYLGKNGDKDEYVYNQAVADAYEEIFKNESVGRVIVGDFTLDAQFVIPDIADILTPQKYEVVNEDIRSGLNDILFGSNTEKFANQSIKVQVFMDRINKARDVFINDFLYPEMQKIADIMGFKAYPKPHFEQIDLKDDLQWGQLYAQLAQYGVLSPAETVKAIETGVLPTEDESLENQKKYRENRDAGLYEPITGGPNTQIKLGDMKAKQQAEKLKQKNGRPAGSKKPQSKKKISPIGTGSLLQASETQPELYFSAKNIKFNLTLANEVQNKIEKQLLKNFKLKKLNDDQKQIVSEICDIIVANEEPHKWLDSVENYIKEPLDKNPERVSLVEKIAFEHQVTPFIASVLLASKTDKPSE